MVNPEIAEGFSALKIKYTFMGTEMRQKIRVRQATLADVYRLLEIDKEIWPNFRASAEMFQSRITVFPEGQFVAVVGGKVVGSVFNQLVNYEDWKDKDFTWDEVTDNGTLRRTHNPRGDSIYGVGLAVAKQFQGSAASRLLTIAAVRWVVSNGRQQILLGARIPGYCRHSDIPVKDYILETRGKRGRLLDPELAFYQKYGGEPIKPLPNYIHDPESLDFGVLIKWPNPFYGKPVSSIFVDWFLRICPSVIW
jgi:hypothetical protein